MSAGLAAADRTGSESAAVPSGETSRRYARRVPNFLPVPQNAIDLNKGAVLTQNAGY